MWGRRNGRGRVGDRYPRSPTKPDQVSTLQCRGMAQQSNKVPHWGGVAQDPLALGPSTSAQTPPPPQQLHGYPSLSSPSSCFTPITPQSVCLFPCSWIPLKHALWEGWDSVCFICHNGPSTCPGPGTL